MNSYEAQNSAFTIVSYISFGLLLLTFIGVSSFAPTYLERLHTIMQVYVGLFLIIRFNPFMKRPNFSELDRKVAYSAGLFIIATTSIAKYLQNIAKKTTKSTPTPFYQHDN